MSLNSMDALLSSIERDLNRAKEQFLVHAFGGHKLLSEQSFDADDLPLAKLLFVVASLGAYRSEELVPVGVGLELLRLAVIKHYRQADENREKNRNLFLVTADYYYAKAIALATGLDKGYVIESMVRAIAEIASLEVPEGELPADTLSFSKHAPLFQAAARLGMFLSEYSSSQESSIEDFALSYGSICQARELQNNSAKALLQRLRDTLAI